MAALTPHVYWAQRYGEITLRVELSDAKVGQSTSNGLLSYWDLSCAALIKCLNASKLYFLNAAGVTLASYCFLH